MKFLRRRRHTAEPERLPQTLPAKCLGESCVNFSGVRCGAYEDLLDAGGSSAARDLPPHKNDATFALYGRVCISGAQEALVSERAIIYRPDEVSLMMIIGLAGRYGELPLVIESGGQQAHVTTVASS